VRWEAVVDKRRRALKVIDDLVEERLGSDSEDELDLELQLALAFDGWLAPATRRSGEGELIGWLVG
jgi:hypothetical protein